MWDFLCFSFSQNGFVKAKLSLAIDLAHNARGQVTCHTCPNICRIPGRIIQIRQAFGLRRVQTPYPWCVDVYFEIVKRARGAPGAMVGQTCFPNLRLLYSCNDVRTSPAIANCCGQPRVARRQSHSLVDEQSSSAQRKIALRT